MTVRHQPQSFEVNDRMRGTLIAPRPCRESSAPSSWPSGCSASRTSASSTSLRLIFTTWSFDSSSSASGSVGVDMREAVGELEAVAHLEAVDEDVDRAVAGDVHEVAPACRRTARCGACRRCSPPPRGARRRRRGPCERVAKSRSTSTRRVRAGQSGACARMAMPPISRTSRPRSSASSTMRSASARGSSSVRAWADSPGPAVIDRPPTGTAWGSRCLMVSEYRALSTPTNSRRRITESQRTSRR